MSILISQFISQKLNFIIICHFSGEAGNLRNLKVLAFCCWTALSLSICSHMLLWAGGTFPRLRGCGLGYIAWLIRNIFHPSVTAGNSVDEISYTTQQQSLCIQSPMVFSSLPSSTASWESTVLPMVCSRQPPQNSCCPLGQMRTISYLWLVLMTKGFLCGSDAKESACNAGDPGLIPGSERSPGEGNCNPLQYFLSGAFHGPRTWWATYSSGCRRTGHNWVTNTWRLRG